MLRKIGKKILYSANTYRYEIEYPRLVEAIDRHIGKLEVLVDAGAGSGYYSSRLLFSGRCKKVIAYEPFAQNFERLRETFSKDFHRVDIEQRGVESIPLGDKSVDVVMCCQVLEHIEEHERVAREFTRILKPGGYALITVPKPPEPHPQIDHVREGYSEDELDTLFLPLGFKKIDNDWFYTDFSKRQSNVVKRWGKRGLYVPRIFPLKELGMSREERRDCVPYGLLGLFQKSSDEA